ncbi:hypothetical protein EBU71_07105 [bacterium]|jgi:hypothetical protein|nr:hypothetical protein [Candidatus Elulimicrobium humile]
MSFANLTRKEAVTLLKKVQDIAALLKDIHEIIESENVDPSDPEDNVIQIVPHVVQQFAKNQKITMNVINIVTLYENWTQQLYGATITNKGHMKNKVIRRHITEAYDICKSIENVLKRLVENN